jgi:hypothetical protein
MEIQLLYSGTVYMIEKIDFHPLPYKVVWDKLKFLNVNPHRIVNHFKGLNKKRKMVQIRGL